VTPNGFGSESPGSFTAVKEKTLSKLSSHKNYVKSKGNFFFSLARKKKSIRNRF